MTIGNLNSALYTATAGMRAAQYDIDVASQNISNANTPGYTLKTSAQETVIGPDGGASVTNGVITRSVNTAVEQQYLSSLSTQGANNTTSSYLSQLNTALGTATGATGTSGDAANSDSVSGLLSNLSDSFTALQADPSSTALQSAVVSSASGLADDLNSTSNTIQSLRSSTENDISTTVNSINTTLGQIQGYNEQISQAAGAGESTANLEDKMDTALQTLSGYMQISTYTNSDGTVNVSTAQGQSLVDGTAVNQLSFTAQGISATSSNLNGVTLNGTDITSQLGTGQLGALFTLRDTTLPQAQAQLDELSGVMMSQLNSNGVQLFTDPNNANFTYPADTTGLASRIEVNPTVAANTWMLRDGTAAATQSTDTGNTTIIDNVINNVFGATQTFRTSGLGTSATLNSGLSANDTLSGYATSFITYQADASSNATNVDSNQQSVTTAPANPAAKR